MNSPTLAPMRQSPLSLSGTWKLAPGRAMTLHPHENGLLRVVSGRVWVTCDGPHEGALNNLGDHILDAGAQMRLRAGKRWVVEAWTGAAPAHFNWVRL
jgi:uncharacterized cupin superfamily protein